MLFSLGKRCTGTGSCQK